MDSAIKNEKMKIECLREGAGFAFLPWLLRGLAFALIFLFISNHTSYAATHPAGDLAPYGAPDGQLNAADVLILQRFVNNNLTTTDDELLIGDVSTFTQSSMTFYYTMTR